MIGFIIPMSRSAIVTGPVIGIVMVVALLMFIAGVILSTLRQKDRRDFEFKLIQADWMKKRT